MKKYLLTLIILCFSFSAYSADTPINLILHHFVPPSHSPHKNMLIPWARNVEKLSKFKVRITIAPKMSLGGKPSQLIKQVQEGKVDLVWTVNGYSGTDFIRSEVFELPFVHTNDPIATNLAMREMYESDLKQDYDAKNVEVMFLHVTQGHAIQTKGYTPKRPEDLRSKRIRVPVRTQAWAVQELGGYKVKVPVTKIHQVLTRNVADTILIPGDIVGVIGLERQISTFTEGPNKTRFANTVFQVSMNKDKWKSLPPDIKKAFRKASDKTWLRKVGKLWQDDDQAGITRLKQFQRTHNVLTQKEIDAFRDALKNVESRWIAEATERDVDAMMIIEKARKLIKKYSR